LFRQFLSDIIPPMRIFPSVLLALFLLLGQQGGTLHALKHAFAKQSQQQKKSSPHANDCEQCLGYAQLGGTLNSHYFSFDFLSSATQAYAYHASAFLPRRALPAIARGPPSSQSLS
jgi:hypothetical protein